MLAERIRELERAIAPVSLAGIRRLPVPGELASVLPVGGVQRGSVVTVGGRNGSGVTSAALQLGAAATAAGEWVAMIDVGMPGGAGLLGGAAAMECGVELSRCAVVRNVPDARWSVVVGALLDGVTMVIAAAPLRLTLGDARRLQARARERQAILVVLESVPSVRVGVWPAEATLRMQVLGGQWVGLEVDGGGRLQVRTLDVHVEGKGVPHRPARQPGERVTLARAG